MESFEGFEWIEKPHAFFDSFERKGEGTATTHYCPGCGHGIVHKLLAEAIDDLGIQDRTILVTPIGCAVFMYYYFEVSAVSVAHGRAPAAGTAISRAWPEAVTISYQGDGDLAAIGMSHIIHAANRGENMIVLFINNNNYGMTGGQMAPTTLIGQKTATTPYGRCELNDGLPVKMSELIAGLQAPVFVARTSVASPKAIYETRRLIHKGLQAQIDQKGFVFIEILSPCPTNWHKTPVEACRWIEEEVVPAYPLGTFKDELEFRFPRRRELKKPTFDALLKQLGLNRNASESTTAELPFETLRIKIAGFGGQGVLSLGMALANLGLKRGAHVTWLPSYGPEMRGGVANCSVVLSRREIGSPVIDRPDLLIALNHPSFETFGPLVPQGGTILYNSSMVEAVPERLAARSIPIAATELATAVGNIKTANSVMLAAAAKALNLFSFDELADYSDSVFERETLQRQNRAALQAGWDLLDAEKGER